MGKSCHFLCRKTRHVLKVQVGQQRRNGRRACRGVATQSLALLGQSYVVCPVDSAPDTQTPNTRLEGL